MALNSLFTNKKFNKLSRLLKMPKPHVLGHLEYLWHSTHSNCDPNVGSMLDIEGLAEWVGEDGVFFEALKEAEFIDEIGDSGEYEIHDWEDHVPPYVRKKLARRKQIERQWADSGRPVGDRKPDSGSGERKGLERKGKEKKNNKPLVEIPDEILDYTKRFNDLVVEVRGKTMDDLHGQSVSAMDIMRKRNHTMGEMDEILKYLRKTMDDNYAWMRQGQLTLKSMDGRIKNGTEWKSVYILDQAKLLNRKPTIKTESVNKIPTTRMRN
jgi:hypothetical protein